jgi:formamidopyrimidine-DNA glycosylase
VTAKCTAYFTDPRRFGVVELLTDEQLTRRLSRLGAEPLKGALEMAVLWRTKRPVKVALLDQQLVAGVGNIYACESLWRARIHPRRLAHRLSPDELQRLHRGLVTAMRKGIGYGPRIYAVQTFAVYNRAGQRCPRCRGTVRRIIQAQRSTFFCPGCQR